MLFTETLVRYINKTPREEAVRKNILLKPSDKLYTEAIRYLGYRNDKNITLEIDSMIHKGMIETCAIAEPRALYRYFFIQNTIDLNCDFMFHEHEGIILMGATLGVSIDRLLGRTQIKDMLYALVLDSCATAAIEEVCDNLQIDLTSIYINRNRYLTDRYSPGYGSLPLSIQSQLLFLLDAERKIGLGATENFLLTPSKSITAMMWVDRSQPKIEYNSCNICKMCHTCNFRRGKVYDE
ncbi:MAG: hypothetical protein LBL40_00990 [Coxiellaceae bacterium]|jgi:hypothetical protein|nr:hypothetical protein [Coxiellaceae bacterium]